MLINAIISINVEKITNFRIIGIGGSILGFKAIYNFLYHKVKRKVEFVDNLKSNIKNNLKNKKNFNLVISKSGNTLETLTNANLLLKKNDYNVKILFRVQLKYALVINI